MECKRCQYSKEGQLAKELSSVEYLHRIVERVVPFVNAHAHLHITEIERDHGERSPCADRLSSDIQ
jgi:hypothetical protein